MVSGATAPLDATPAKAGDRALDAPMVRPMKVFQRPLSGVPQGFSNVLVIDGSNANALRDIIGDPLADALIDDDRGPALLYDVAPVEPAPTLAECFAPGSLPRTPRNRAERRAHRPRRQRWSR